MRSISSVFGLKPSNKPLPSRGSSSSLSLPAGPVPPAKKHSRLFSTISRKSTTDVLRSPLVPLNDQVPSSRSSSTASNSLPTPGDDETVMPPPTATKLPWKSWLGAKKSSSAKKSTQQWAVPRHAWRSRPLAVLQSPPPGRLELDDTEDDETSSESDDESDTASISNGIAVPRSPAVTPQALDNALTNLRIMTENGLQPPFSPPPLLFAPGQPVFPRSSNPRRALYRRETLESRLHRTQILRQIDTQQLTRAQELSIISFGKRAAALTNQRPSLHLNEEAVPNTFQSCTFSQGLQKWTSRPCFEDRMDVWVPDSAEGDFLCTRVTGPSFGVAALEISGHLDVLAGANYDDVDIEPNPPSNSTTSLLSIPAPSHHAPNAPSPLRIEHSPPPLPLPIPPDSDNEPDLEPDPESDPEPEPQVMSAVSNVKRGVRFAEDDKEDQIPLGYVLRIRKKREEKAKFLREEKERRAFEQERVNQEAERARREIERREWELEKLAWEKEKRAQEEERKQRYYAEDIAATRFRRDAARSGFYAPPVPLGMEKTGPQLGESRSLRKLGQNLPPISTRRQSSDTVALATGSGTPYSASPISSSPPSNGGSPATSALFSRPSSINSATTNWSSAEDVLQNHKIGKARNSFGSDFSQQQAADRHSKSYYPPWSSTYPFLPPPSMPFYNMDMPLLPPAPPFMMQSRRSHSPNSGSNGSSSRHKPNSLSRNSNNSSERLSSSSDRRGSLDHYRRGSSNDALKGAEKPTGLSRRSGSAADIQNPWLSAYSTIPYTQHQQLQQQSSTSRSPSAWATSLPRNARDRPLASRRENVIT